MKKILGAGAGQKWTRSATLLASTIVGLVLNIQSRMIKYVGLLEVVNFGPHYRMSLCFWYRYSEGPLLLFSRTASTVRIYTSEH